MVHWISIDMVMGSNLGSSKLNFLFAKISFSMKVKGWLVSELEELNWGGAKETIGDQRGSFNICVLSKETK